MGAHRIPLSRVGLGGREQEYVADAMAQGRLGGGGPYTEKCQTFLETELGATRVLLTNSGTGALDIAALLLDVGPSDEVIVPSFTFASTANSFAVRGARPVFAEIRADTLNLDERALERRITPRTKAIVPVHYAGVACAMSEILDIARRFGVAVIEDNAHGPFGTYQKKALGTFGSVAALSFHQTKNFTCGEGGALVINDPALISRAECLREMGTNRSSFLRGDLKQYGWVDIGSSYLPSELQAAYLLGQLESRNKIQTTRRKLWEYYHQALSGWATERNVQLPVIPADCESAYHLFHLQMGSGADRQALIEHLRAHEIESAFHYLPLHLSDFGRRLGGKPGDCPVAECASGRLIRLPFFHELTEAEQDRVIAAVRTF